MASHSGRLNSLKEVIFRQATYIKLNTRHLAQRMFLDSQNQNDNLYDVYEVN